MKHSDKPKDFDKTIKALTRFGSSPKEKSTNTDIAFHPVSESTKKKIKTLSKKMKDRFDNPGDYTKVTLGD